MEYNEFVVAGRDDVLLQVIGAHGVGQRLGCERMLRQVSGRASMGNDDGPHTLISFNNIR
jgi:hypothetical protein